MTVVTPTRGRRACKRCGVAGHYQSTCMMLPGQQPAAPPAPPPRAPEPAGPSTLPTLRQIERIAPPKPAPSASSARTCSRCGAKGHDARTCTMQAPTAASLLGAEDNDDELDEDSAVGAAEDSAGESSAWDPDEDDMPTAPPAVTVPAPRRRPAPAAKPTSAPAPRPLTLVMFTSHDGGITCEKHELALSDVTVAREIVDLWDTPAILVRGRRIVHAPSRVPIGLVMLAAERIRGAA